MKSVEKMSDFSLEFSNRCAFGSDGRQTKSNLTEYFSVRLLLLLYIISELKK